MSVNEDTTREKPRPQPIDAELPSAKAALVLMVITVLLGLPMLLYGPMVRGDDTYEHINYTRHFANQFWNGEWYPRWLLGMNHGLGSPTFFIYPPFVSYVYALLLPAGKAFGFDAFNVGVFLALMGSGLAAFFWLRQLASGTAALVGAALYVLMPYHLAIDFYRRTAISECWAFVWMPLFLYFTAPALCNRRSTFVGAAVAYALLIVSHPVSALIFSCIPILAALTAFPARDWTKCPRRIVGAMALGVALSSFYLLPAFFHARDFPVLKLLSWPYYTLSEQLIGLNDLRGRTGFAHSVALSTFSTMVLLTVAGLVVFAKGKAESRRQAIFWLVVCVPPTVLMWTRSLFVWTSFPPLLKAIQYPWRFNIVLCLAVAAIGTLFVNEIPHLSFPLRITTVSVASLVVVAWLISYGIVWRHYANDIALPRLSVSHRLLVNDDDGWFEAWTVPELDQASAREASTGPQVRFVGASGTAKIVLWNPRRIEFDTDNPAGGTVMVNQFYYPRWTAFLDDARLPINVKPAMPEGLLEVEVPPGRHKVWAEIPISVAERFGQYISVSSLILIVILLADDLKNNKTAKRIDIGNSSLSI